MTYDQPALETIISNTQGYHTAKPEFLYIIMSRKKIVLSLQKKKLENSQSLFINGFTHLITERINIPQHC